MWNVESMQFNTGQRMVIHGHLRWKHGHNSHEIWEDDLIFHLNFYVSFGRKSHEI